MTVFNEEMLSKRSQLILTDAQLGLLNGAVFTQHDLINRATRNVVLSLYEHMKSGQHPSWRGKRPCNMNIEIFKPISHEQSRKLDQENAQIGWMVRTAAGSVAALVTHNALVGAAAGAAAGKYAMSKLRTWDTGDILVCVGARVSGGIGQQARNESFVVKRTAYGDFTVSF